MWNTMRNFWYEEDGVGVVEIILILVVLIALVLLFKEKLQEVVESALENISSGADEIVE